MALWYDKNRERNMENKNLMACWVKKMIVHFTTPSKTLDDLFTC